MRQEDATLVVGADGLIGRALVDHLVLAGRRVVGTTRRTDIFSPRRTFLDLSKNISNWTPPCRISKAYICAAVSSIEHCQNYASQSANVNVHNTFELAKVLVKNGSFVVFPSTNLVYDGSIPYRKADDLVCPSTEYGRQKAEAESRLLALGNLISVVRFTKILDPKTTLFRGWIQSLNNNKVIHPFSDMVMAPLPLTFVINVLRGIADMRLSGVSQASGEKDVTYEEVSRHVVRCIGVSPSLVQAVKSEERGIIPEAAPRHTTLDSTRLKRVLGVKPPNAECTISWFLTLMKRDLSGHRNRGAIH